MVATSPLPPGGPHRFKAGGQNQNWPTSGQGGYITAAAWGSPPLQSGGIESDLAHKWARWLHHPCGPRGVPTASERGDRIRIGPQVGKMATLPLPLGGSAPLPSRGTESEVAHKWARWLHHPCRLGGPHRFRAGEHNQRWPTSGQGGYMTPAAWGVPHRVTAGGRIRSGPQVGKVATSPLPPGGSPSLQSGGTESEVAHQWARWLHHPCHRGVPTASERGGRIKSGPQVGKVATSPLPSRGSPPLQSGGTESELAHTWWLHHPCRLGVPTASERGDRIRSGPQVGKVATSPLPPRGVPTASERGDRIRIGPQVGKVATLPLPLGGSPPLQSGGTESEVAHKWARWLHDPCRLGGPHRFRAGGQNPKWPTSVQRGYITPAASGVPTASERGDRIRSGPQVGKVATSPLPPRGVPTASERGDRIRIGPQVGKVATLPLPLGGSPPLQSGGTESEVAHKWARWLHDPCRLGGPHRFRAGGQNPKWPTSVQRGYITPAASGVPTASERGDRIRSGPQVGKVAT